ncbi:MAG: hypothetical protein ACI9XO_002393 [Paraglaciecola sp.]|jgi:uncharacterized protein YyaL (SSP411 family)
MNFLKILFSIAILTAIGCNAFKSQSGGGDHLYTNKLINESSPYLLQHAHNPVDWNPWKEEALAEAKKENKLLLISIGYAACHWCHVMEHESFEDTIVARIMNENFVPIKVDREERPDVDDVYMTACQLASQKGCGWPLNAIALPDGRPIWAGTYFPKKEWVKVLDYFIKIWKEEPEKLEEYAVQLTEGVKSLESIDLNPNPSNFQADSLKKIVVNFVSNVDMVKGGRVGAPKFPMPNNWQFLLRYHHFTGNTQAMEAVDKTLTEMAMGGIYDHLGGGFARYSTDAEWKVPHFEKMLYDNGQLMSVYSQAYQLTKNPLYKQRVEETLEFTAREMTSKEGGFYSSYDADSEGEEGKFYIWEKHEIDSLIKEEMTAKIFYDYYEISKRGNWEEDKNILYRRKTEEQVAKKNNVSVAELNTRMAAAKKTLFEARKGRIMPGLDDKVLTSWNALMTKGYVDAFKAFGNEDYQAVALKNGEFILSKMMQSDGRLNRNYKDGKSVINAFLDDYALTIESFIGLYEITFDEKWLNKSDELAKYVIAHFHDKESGMFFYTSDLDPPLITRKKEVTDNVIPGSNSAMARSLFYLGTYLYNDEYTSKAEQMLNNLAGNIVSNRQPNFYSNWCQLYLDFVNRPYEVAIVGDDFEVKRNALMQNYIPNALLLGGKTEGNLELLKGKLQEGETMIYVCRNKVCKLPVMEVEQALPLLK